MNYSAVRIVTTNDRNGNPRRGWLIAGVKPGYDYASYRFFIDEGYNGDRELREWSLAHGFDRQVPVIYTADVKPTEYTRLRNYYRDNGEDTDY